MIRGSRNSAEWNRRGSYGEMIYYFSNILRKKAYFQNRLGDVNWYPVWSVFSFILGCWRFSKFFPPCFALVCRGMEGDSRTCRLQSRDSIRWRGKRCKRDEGYNSPSIRCRRGKRCSRYARRDGPLLRCRWTLGKRWSNLPSIVFIFQWDQILGDIVRCWRGSQNAERQIGLSVGLLIE